MSRNTRVAAASVIAAVFVAGAAALYWWPAEVATPPAAPPPAAVATAPEVPASAVAAPADVAPAAPPPAREPKPDRPPLVAADIPGAAAELLGAKVAKTWLHTDELPRRLVATIDNLGREHAPSMLWPVNPTAGRFSVIESPGHKVINPDNQLRYTPFVQLFEAVDTPSAVALYVRMLPLLQQAYEELGFPGRRFHTRLLEVIDHLLAAPEPAEPIEVKLTEVRGPIAATRPWVRYEFADPALESASAGHKLMVRIGAPNQRRLKTKLREMRGELVRRADE